MSFLAPLFLVGALALGLPVVFHLIRRSARERIPFSSLLFLTASPPRLTRRSRLEHLLLLALRCGVLCLLVLGFARPFFRKPLRDGATDAPRRRMVILIDTSASMRRGNLWGDARERAEAVAGAASPLDEVALLSFDRGVKPLVSFEEWDASPPAARQALLRAKLAAATPGWAGTHLGTALIAASELLADTSGESAASERQIILISDLQAGVHLDQLQGYEWPKGIQLKLEPLKPRLSSNAGLELLAEDEATASNVVQLVRVRINNTPDSKREQFKLGWAQARGNDFFEPSTNIYVPAGKSRTVTLTVPPTEQVQAPVGVLLQGDEEPFDNRVFVVPAQPARVQVLCLGGGSVEDVHQSAYFVQRAFQQTRREAFFVASPAPGSQATASDVRNAGLLIVAGAISETEAGFVRAQVALGKTLLVAIQSDMQAAFLAELFGVDHVSLEEVKPANYAMLGEIDFRHPLFAPFADPRFSDFTHIHFWKYRRLDLGSVKNSRMVARFDNGDPAVVEVPLAKGRVVVLTSSWRPSDSQFALSTKFVPFLYALVEQGNSAAAPAQYRVGDVVALPPGSVADSPITVTAPDGSVYRLGEGETNFTRSVEPGIYTAARLDGLVVSTFAVNLDPKESQTARMTTDELERLGAPIAAISPRPGADARAKIMIRNAELESRQKIWRWMLVAGVVVLLLETWLSARTARAPLTTA